MRKTGFGEISNPSLHAEEKETQEAMKHWTFTARVEPPTGVVSGRFGGSVMFVAYSKPLHQWYWIYPGGEEKIAQPQMLFLDEEWARAHPAKNFSPKVEKPLAIRQRKAEQLLLF
jgi:hypothetical protein